LSRRARPGLFKFLRLDQVAAPALPGALPLPASRHPLEYQRMKVGLFDHVDRSDRPLATQLDERLAFVQAADAAGIYCYHVAEHHASPLNMVPVPGAYLGAVARLTKRIHLGPLVYLLPLYSPLRLIEEIVMLDHLSKGRLEVGIGRGVSPFELSYHKVAHDKSREIFLDAYACLKEGLTHDPFSYSGEFFTYKDVPMPLRPLQQPHPAFWYGSSNPGGAAWAGEQGLHFATNGPTARAKANVDAYREALAKRGGPAQPKAEFKGGAAIGISRQIVVADTDAEARRIAEPASAHHHANLTYLKRLHAGDDLAERLSVPTANTFSEALKEGTVIAGSPATVAAEITRQAETLGLTYLISYLFFGTMSLAEALRSLQLFSTEVMPKLEAL
jgi:alkanesulfonate monooxygenase SsuD/methylene tetrahydromethanopterin reductase-like flavin-dependent oxidoreductase (luciferase family)